MLCADIGRVRLPALLVGDVRTCPPVLCRLLYIRAYMLHRGFEGEGGVSQGFYPTQRPTHALNRGVPVPVVVTAWNSSTVCVLCRLSRLPLPRTTPVRPDLKFEFLRTGTTEGARK